MTTAPISPELDRGLQLPPSTPPTRHHRLRWTIVSVVGLFVVVTLTAGWLVYRAIAVVNTKKLDGSNSRLSFFQQLGHLVGNKNQALQGETDDRINILLLGIGGPGHDGPYLTDTMIVTSYQPSTNQLALLSIPRDLVVNIPGYDYRKINNVLAFGRDRQYPGGGEALTVKVVSDLLDVPIQYYARVDFQGFQDIIDRVGGVDVTVDTAFADYQFPNDRYGYQTVRFAAGPQHMNGLTALNFARSRHGTNGEGSDFARAARQQKIIEALKVKLFSFGTLANPKKVSDILGSLGNHSQTNMEVWEMIRLTKLAGQVKSDQITNIVLDNGPNGLLQDETGLGGAFILVPRGRNYQDIRFLAQNIFLVGQAMKERAAVMVVNATRLNGLAETVNRGLAGFGLSVVKPVTLKDATIGQTVMIDLGQGRYPKTADLLATYVRARGSITLAEWTDQTGDSTLPNLVANLRASTNANSNGASNTNKTSARLPNLLVILGQDQPKDPGLAVIPLFRSTPAPLASAQTKAVPTSSHMKKL